MEPSILKSVKKVLGLAPEYTAFDQDVILFVNSALATVNQLGVGPDQGFEIEDDSAVWVSLLGDDPRFNSVKTYICLKVKLAFDPPPTSFAINAMEEQIEELGARISTLREGRDWRAPTRSHRIPQVIDGGSP